MTSLWKDNLFQKEDIQKYHLVDLCFRWNMECSDTIVSDKIDRRFQFLIQKDPDSLKASSQPRTAAHHSFYARAKGDTLLHSSVKLPFCSNLEGFQRVLEIGIHHFPNEIGFLFHVNDNRLTPYRLACTRFGTKKTLAVIRKVCFDIACATNAAVDNEKKRKAILMNASSSSLSSSLSDVDDDQKQMLLLKESFLLAATDANIHLDSLHFQLLQNPTLVQHLVLSSPIVVAVAKVIVVGNAENDNDNAIAKTKKRKKNDDSIFGKIVQHIKQKQK